MTLTTPHFDGMPMHLLHPRAIAFLVQLRPRAMRASLLLADLRRVRR